jgi:hypothetical protein
MTFKCSLFITLLFVSIGCFGQPIVSHFLAPQADISKGRPFKTIEEQSEVIIKGLNSLSPKVVQEFNSQGFIVSRVALNSAGGRTSETTWEYIDGKKLTYKKHRFFANMSGWTEDEVKVEWDYNSGLPTKVEVLRNGRVTQWALMTIDTLGRIESAKVFGPTGAHTFTERFMYMEPSNMIRVMMFRSNGVFSSNWTYPIDLTKEFSFESLTRQYYPNGDVMVETLKDSTKGDQAYYYEYDYDNQGNWVEKRTYQVSLGRNNSIRNKKLEHRFIRKIGYQ